jgi:putative membrane protein
MKYFTFLFRFVVIPLLGLRLVLWRDRARSRPLPEALQSWPEDAVLLAHVAVAVAYTTPWDNYLVANRIWSYDPKLVTGLMLGYVPIEEYIFFVLQTLLAGSLTGVLMRRIPAEVGKNSHSTYRLIATGGLGAVWAASVFGLLQDRRSYLALILAWALPPIMLQVGYGGDILWRHRRSVAASIIPATAYLGATDSLAIGSGTWAINPAHTIGVDVASRNLPFEELLFFFLTNVLLVFGVTLVLSRESEERLPTWLKPAYQHWKQWLLARTRSESD